MNWAATRFEGLDRMTILDGIFQKDYDWAKAVYIGGFSAQKGRKCCYPNWYIGYIMTYGSEKYIT